MKYKCQGCGVEKDLTAIEEYPYPDGRISPGCPLLEIDCDEKRVIVCYECFHRLDPDMWISRACWEGIGAVVPFDELPLAPTNEKGWVPILPQVTP